MSTSDSLEISSETVPLATAHPIILTEPVPQHPYMASNGRSNIHNDAYMTDSYDVSGPLGGSLSIRKAILGGLPATITFDTTGRLNALAISPTGKRRLALLDPGTLRVLAINDELIPGKDTGGDFGGGGYFYLDQQDRLVIPTVDLTVMIIEVMDAGGASEFQAVKTYDLSTAIKEAHGDSFEEDESIQSALPDGENNLWFVTKYGVVGTVLLNDDPDGASILTYNLVDPDSGAQERIGNSFAVDPHGDIYIVSDHALYSFRLGASGPQVVWREAYDRGTRQKPGQTNFGSGTTPTLSDYDGKQFVAITDNADPQMHVLVYRREADYTGPRLICQQPVFQDNAGCTENSLIGANKSLIVENNYGYAEIKTTSGSGTTGYSGVSRVDFDPDGGGGQVVWTNNSSVPSVVSKLSLASGLIYTYTKKPSGWYFTAINFYDGSTVFEVLTGVSNLVNNHYAGLYLGPDGRAYVGVLEGVVSIALKED